MMMMIHVMYIMMMIVDDDTRQHTCDYAIVIEVEMEADDGPYSMKVGR